MSPREQIEAWNRVPLQVALAAHRIAPLRRCPRRSCRSPRLSVQREVWACLSCGALGAGGAFWAALALDWGSEQYGRAIGL